ncbi:uncharacterized protein [Macrobrachium rosenbergii]|uniref:uncharacterized protein n=1 Tax=Macrobrachium rosenbergii TaxID=79674 RepID=UPI0034D52F3C
MSMYLDDWLMKAHSKAKCVEDLIKTLSLAKELGLLVNVQKSSLSPSQRVVYLGVRMDSLAFRASPSIRRVESCLSKIDDFLHREVCSANQWMSLLGTLASMEKFVKLGRLKMRPLQFYLQSRWPRKTHPDSFLFKILDRIKKELVWWNSRERLEEGISLYIKNPDLTLLSDASDQGWGATLDNKECSGQWQEEQKELQNVKELHINVKELKVVHL